MALSVNGYNVEMVQYRTIFLQAAAGYPTTTNGCTTETRELPVWGQSIYWLVFDPDTVQYAEWGFVLPANYDGGQMIANIYWEKEGAGNGNVVWRLQGTVFGDSDAVDADFGTAVSFTGAASGFRTLTISGWSSPFTLAGTPYGGKFALIRVNRFATDAGDTLAEDVNIIGVMIKYTTTRSSDDSWR